MLSLMHVQEMLFWCMGLFPQGQNPQALEKAQFTDYDACSCSFSVLWPGQCLLVCYASLLILVLFFPHRCLCLSGFLVGGRSFFIYLVYLFCM